MDAASDVPMTDDEKSRLTELLKDIEEEQEEEETKSVKSKSSRAIVSKSKDSARSLSTTKSIESEGYSYSESDMSRMYGIDSKLRTINSNSPAVSASTYRSRLGSINGSIHSGRDGTLGSRNCRAIDTISIRSEHFRKESGHSGRLSEVSDENMTHEYALSVIMEDNLLAIQSIDSDNEGGELGEKVLIEVRDAREKRNRLNVIESKLLDLKTETPYPIETELPKVPDDQMKALIAQCRSELTSARDDDVNSVATFDDGVSTDSHLSDAALSSLLGEAKRELGLLSIEAPQSTLNSDGELISNTTALQLYDNETWSFLREVEARLEYPPAFLKALPDYPGSIVDDDDEKTLKGSPEPIQESSGISTRSSQPGSESISRPGTSSSTSGEQSFNQDSRMSPHALPPLSGKRRQSSKSETKRKNSGTSKNESDQLGLRLDGQSFISSNHR